MKKIRFLPFAMTLLAVNMAFAADEIHWTITGKDSVTFDWRGTAAEKTIGYGLTSGVYTQVTATTPNPVPVSSSGPFWEAKLTGLTENTRYYYSIGNGPELSFRTPPAPGSSDFTVYAQGNIGSSTNYFNMGVVQDIIADDLPSFVVGLGNLTLGSTNGKAAVDQHFNDVMVWSKEAAYMPIWGNQEWKTTSSDNFKNYKGRFAVPNPQTSPGSPLAGGKDWYWFDYGNVRFITMPDSWTGAWTDWKTKADALMTQAQTDPKIKFIVTMVHQPAYSSGHYPGSSTLKGILDSLGDTHSKYKLNINAHSNNYERSFSQHGVIHVTAGTGGANLTQDGTCLWATCAQPSWSAFRAMHLGALKLHFTATGIDGSFICGPAGGGINDVTCTKGSVVDSFTIGASSTAAPSVSKAAATTNNSVTAQAPIVSAATTCTQAALNVSGATSDGGFSYKINKSFGTPADNSSFSTQSTLRFFENGLEMGPGHSAHLDISNLGLGRFSHWLSSGGIESLRFSASNNADPRTNGKSYSYCLTTTTTSDTQAPTAPTGLAATASSSTQVNLSWSASTDNVGVTGYKVFRNGSQIGTTNAMSYSDLGLTASTSYSYTVAAYDAAGNISGNSTAATATTAAPPPTTTSSCAPAPTSSLVVSVKDKGATGNGSNNDTAAIQAAIKQVSGTGGTVLVPDGMYMVDATVGIYLGSKMTFRMSNNAIIKAIPNNQSSYRIIRINNVSDVNMIGGTVMGERNMHTGTSGESGIGVSVESATNLVVEGVTAKDGWGDGFYVGISTAGKTNSNLKYCSVIADNNRRSGMSIVSVDGLVVKDSIFKNTNGGTSLIGVDLEPNQGGTVKNVQILNSQMLNNPSSGIELSVRSELLGNAFITNVTIDGNTVANNSAVNGAGIAVTKTSGHRISNNIVKDNRQDGIDLTTGASNNIVTGNTVTGNGFDYKYGVGILMYNKAINNTITNNTATGNKYRNILDSAGGNTISGNTAP